MQAPIVRVQLQYDMTCVAMSRTYTSTLSVYTYIDRHVSNDQENRGTYIYIVVIGTVSCLLVSYCCKLGLIN